MHNTRDKHIKIVEEELLKNQKTNELKKKRKSKGEKEQKREKERRQ